MERKIRILGIAPYEGLKKMMINAAAEYPQVDLEVLVGDMEDGLKAAQGKEDQGFDLIISRGGTAQLLRKNLNIPVIEIEISLYDILCTLKLAEGRLNRLALVSFAKTASHARRLCSVLGYSIDIYTLETKEDVEKTMAMASRRDYSAMLCDMIAYTTSQKLGFNSYLITAGPDSVKQAFENALDFCEATERLRSENRLLRGETPGDPGESGDLVTVDINRTLSEISKDIALRVLKNNSGNQSKAARSLGSSRTTMWRLMKD